MGRGGGNGQPRKKIKLGVRGKKMKKRKEKRSKITLKRGKRP